MFYTVTLLDIDGTEMARNPDCQNLKAARAEARLYLTDREYAADASHVLIENDAGELIDTVFAKGAKGPRKVAS